MKTDSSDNPKRQLFQPQDVTNNVNTDTQETNLMQTTQIIAQGRESKLRDAMEVEKTIQIVSNLFSDMAVVIHKQDEIIDRIEDDVEAGLHHVELGEEKVEEFHGIIKGNRPLIIKIFGIMIALILVVKFVVR